MEFLTVFHVFTLRDIDKILSDDYTRLIAGERK